MKIKINLESIKNIEIKPIHMLLISVLMIILSRYVFEYVNPWLGWMSYGGSVYVLYKSLTGIYKTHIEKEDEDEEDR